MFGTIRKHQNWLWGIIITLTIISFVIFFSPVSKVNNARGLANFGSVNGERITEENFYNAQNEIKLQYFFMSQGNWLSNEQDAKRAGFDPEQRTYLRLLAIQKEEQLGIHVSSEAAAQVATDMLRRLNISSPEDFLKQVLTPHGMSVEDFDRFVRHEFGIQELILIAGLSGKLTTPQEAESLYIREHEPLATELVFFSASNYLGEVSTPAEAISQFYSNRLAEYRIPERVQVSYVKFGISNRLAGAEKALTNLTEIIEANFARLGTNNYKDAKSPEESKTRIREDIIRSRALGEARREAAQFAGPLFDMKETRAENLEIAAKTNGLQVSVTPPFDRADGPTNLDAGPDFAKAAFALSADEPFAQPIVGHDGVYVIAFNKRLPSEVPTLESIRDRVVADYKFSQAVNLARRAGLAAYRTLTNSMAQGKSFSAAASEAKLAAVELPPFSLSTRELPAIEDKISLNGRDGLNEIAISTPPGKLSEFHATSDGGLLAYVKSRLPLDEAKMKSELPAFVAYVRQNRQREAFEAWFHKEAEKGLRDTPLFRPQQAPKLAPGSAKS
jgi:hypothetical protein